MPARVNRRIVMFRAGWYTFELRYRNPTEVIHIGVGEAGAGGAAALTDQQSFFYISTRKPPRDYYYAPSIALSSTFQVRA